MRQFLISSMAPALWIMTFFDGFAIFKMFSQSRKGKKNQIAFLTGILCLGLFYDSLILSCGVFLSYGSFFRILSRFRFIFHCVLIPLLFPICAYSLKLNGKIVKIVWIISLIIMVIGLAASLSVVLEERTLGAIRRYAQSDLTGKFADQVISLLDVVPVFFMIGIGVFLWIRKKNPNMFFSGFFMLLFTLLGIFLGKDPSGERAKSLMFYISMYGEALMVFFLYRFIGKEK